MGRQKRYIFGFIVCVGVASGFAADAAMGWKSVATGMELKSFKARNPISIADSQITVLRINPALWELQAVGASQTGESGSHTARDWSEKYKFAAAINAGMFDIDQKTHLGYMRSGQYVNNNKVNQYQSIAAFDPHDSKLPAFRIFDLDDPGVTAQVVLRDYASAIQNLRLIKRPGNNRWGQQDKRWSEAALGEDDKGWILFIYSRSPFTMHDLNEELLAAGIGLVAAQHLEGGPEAQLYVHAGETKIEMFGSYETSFKENDANSMAWPVPNVLGVRPRSATH